MRYSLLPIIAIILIIILSVLVSRDLSFKYRYRDDPDTKVEWWQKGYDSGVEAAKPDAFLKGYLKGLEMANWKTK